MTTPTPDWSPDAAAVEAAHRAFDEYHAECEAARRADSQRVFGHPGASIPSAHPDRDEAVRRMLIAARPRLVAEALEEAAVAVEAMVERDHNTEHCSSPGSVTIVARGQQAGLQAATVIRSLAQPTTDEGSN